MCVKVWQSLFAALVLFSLLILFGCETEEADSSDTGGGGSDVGRLPVSKSVVECVVSPESNRVAKYYALNSRFVLRHESNNSSRDPLAADSFYMIDTQSCNVTHLGEIAPLNRWAVGRGKFVFDERRPAGERPGKIYIISAQGATDSGVVGTPISCTNQGFLYRVSGTQSISHMNIATGKIQSIPVPARMNPKVVAAARDNVYLADSAYRGVFRSSAGGASQRVESNSTIWPSTGSVSGGFAGKSINGPWIVSKQGGGIGVLDGDQIHDIEVPGLESLSDDCRSFSTGHESVYFHMRTGDLLFRWHDGKVTRVGDLSDPEHSSTVRAVTSNGVFVEKDLRGGLWFMDLSGSFEQVLADTEFHGNPVVLIAEENRIVFKRGRDLVVAGVD